MSWVNILNLIGPTGPGPYPTNTLVVTGQFRSTNVITLTPISSGGNQTGQTLNPTQGVYFFIQADPLSSAANITLDCTNTAIGQRISLVAKSSNPSAYTTTFSFTSAFKVVSTPIVVNASQTLTMSFICIDGSTMLQESGLLLT